jgi:prepilin-type N-terminal cleavage/methylation domain-containing protein
VRNRAGFTLIEILTAMVIVSLLMLIGIPKFNEAIARQNVRGARTTVANMVAKARAAATQGNQRTRLVVNGNRAWIVGSPRRTVGGAGTWDTLGRVENLNTRYGVTLTVTNNDSIKFDPRGLSWNGIVDTMRMTKSGHTDWVAIDAMGRVTK